MKITIELSQNYMNWALELMRSEIAIMAQGYHSMAGHQHLYYTTIEKIYRRHCNKVKPYDLKGKKYKMVVDKGEGWVLMKYFHHARFNTEIHPELAYILPILHQKTL